MPRGEPSIKKSVAVAPDVFRRLSAVRKRNFSRTVNESLRLRAALDQQAVLVAEYEAKHGEIDERELRPHLESVIRAQARAVLMRHEQ